MAYFNHAFQKVFIGTGATRNDSGDPGTINVPTEAPETPFSDGGFITTSGSSTTALSLATGPGYFGMYDKDSWTSLAVGDLSAGECCPLVLVAASLKANDKQGPFHGGYQESNKSKYINPKLLREFYRVDECMPQQNIVHVGTTNYTAGGAVLTISAIGGTNNDYVAGTYTDVPTTSSGSGTGLTVDITVVGTSITTVAVNNPGVGYVGGGAETITVTGGGGTNGTFTVTTVDAADAGCCIPFYCDETYYLRIDVKGSPALRFANHNLYRTLDAYTGCCSGPTPVETDSTLVYIQWAKQIVEDPYLQNFIQPIVFDESGNPWFPDADTATSYGSAATQIWDNYVSPGHTDGDCGGMRLMGAYVDTVFGNCSFQITDHYEKEPIRILASMTDLTGDPCVFEGVCVVEECPALQGMGFGEQVIRDLILSESYLQNFFSTDIRIREITQGDAVFAPAGIDLRSGMFTRYYLLHTVPRFNNPSGTFDNDQYMLDIVTNGPNTSFETFMDTWLTNCGDECTSLVVRGCTPCDPIDVPVVV